MDESLILIVIGVLLAGLLLKIWPSFKRLIVRREVSSELKRSLQGRPPSKSSVSEGFMQAAPEVPAEPSSPEQIRSQHEDYLAKTQIVAPIVAKIYRTYVDEFVKAGFTPEQAVELARDQFMQR